MTCKGRVFFLTFYVSHTLTQSLTLSVFQMCVQWLGQCFWNYLDWPEICHYVCTCVVLGPDYQVYMCIAVLKHLQPDILLHAQTQDLQVFLKVSAQTNTDTHRHTHTRTHKHKHKHKHTLFEICTHVHAFGCMPLCKRTSVVPQDEVTQKDVHTLLCKHTLSHSHKSFRPAQSVLGPAGILPC